MYINTPKGIFVGSFDENDIKAGRDKAAVSEAKHQFQDHKYTATEFVTKRGKITAIRIYITTKYQA